MRNCGRTIHSSHVCRLQLQLPRPARSNNRRPRGQSRLFLPREAGLQAGERGEKPNKGEKRKAGAVPLGPAPYPPRIAAFKRPPRACRRAICFRPPVPPGSGLGGWRVGERLSVCVLRLPRVVTGSFRRFHAAGTAARAVCFVTGVPDPTATGTGLRDYHWSVA